MNLTDFAYGFLAAAIAVVTVHQCIVLVLNKAGLLPSSPWSTKPIGPWGVPTIVNSIFWGGLWGTVYAGVHHWLPGSETWCKGLIFGLLMALVSNFTLLPLIKRKPLFMDMNFKMIACVLLILSGFGMTTALLYEWLRANSLSSFL